MTAITASTVNALIARPFASTLLFEQRTISKPLEIKTLLAVSNAARHAGARHIRVGLSASRTRGKLTVEDDGKGFAKDFDRTRGMGLRIMRYRMEMIGGTIRFESKPKGGARVVCRFKNRRPQSDTSRSA